MAFVIHDDFWESAQTMPKNQRPLFLYALMEYSFSGKMPTGNPRWLPTFIALKKRIDLGKEATNKGRKAAKARWGKGSKSNHEEHEDAYADAYACAYAKPMQGIEDAYAHASEQLDAEKEKEIGEEEPPYSPPMQDPPFWAQCISVLNEELGTCYTSMPTKCRHTLDRSEGTFTARQVRAMVAYKRDEWQNTKFKNCLTPNFLFSPDHFEQCMHQSLADGEEAARYVDYDQI